MDYKMDDNTCKLECAEKRERAERILKKQMGELELMLECVGVEFPAVWWEYLHNNVNLSLASEALPALEGLSMGPHIDMKAWADLAMIKVEYQRSRAFYTHLGHTIFLPMTIHLGLNKESAPDEELRYLLSAELAHALSDFIIKEVHELPRSDAVAEFYEVAFSWWTQSPEEQDCLFKNMKAHHQYYHCFKPGADITEMASEAVKLVYPGDSLSNSDFEEEMELATWCLNKLGEVYPLDDNGNHNPHVIAGSMVWEFLEDISEHTGKPKEECFPELTRVAGKALTDIKYFRIPALYALILGLKLPEYLADTTAKTS